MNTTSQLLLTDIREALARRLSPIAGRTNLDKAFAAWALSENQLGLSTDGAVEQSLASLATAPT